MQIPYWSMIFAKNLPAFAQSYQYVLRSVRGGGILLGGVGYDWEGILGSLRSANRRLSGKMALS
jgi:hypothetical protein